MTQKGILTQNSCNQNQSSPYQRQLGKRHQNSVYLLQFIPMWLFYFLVPSVFFWCALVSLNDTQSISSGQLENDHVPNGLFQILKSTYSTPLKIGGGFPHGTMKQLQNWASLCPRAVMVTTQYHSSPTGTQCKGKATGGTSQKEAQFSVQLYKTQL